MDLPELFEGFHGRKPKSFVNARWLEQTFPSLLYRVGAAHLIRYYSDKRDPGDPLGDGRQGVMKLFHHNFSSGVTLYDPIGARDAKPFPINWPQSSALLGYVAELAYSSASSTTPCVEVYRPGQLELWVWSDARTLMLVDRRSLNFALLRGGRMRVEPRGIVD